MPNIDKDEIKDSVVIRNVTATFVGTKGKDGFAEVIKDFENAQEVRVLTYSKIGNGNDSDKKLKIIRELAPGKKLRIIVAIPGLLNKKINGQIHTNLYSEDDIITHLDKIKNQITAIYSSEDLEIYVCFKNHAKLVGTENVLYVGSANYNDYSHKNYEAGMIIRDKNSIKEIYEKYFDKVVAVQYCADKYDTIRLNLLSLVDEIEELEIFIHCFISCFDERVENFNSIKKQYEVISSRMEDITRYINDNKKNIPIALSEDICTIENDIDNISEFISGAFDSDYNKNMEYFADYYENEHMDNKGVFSSDAWIDEETPYVMLSEETEQEYYISEYWTQEITEKSVVKETLDLLNAIVKTAKVWLYKKPYDMFKAQLVQIGTDENVLK